jgi:hypothetical protein
LDEICTTVEMGLSPEAGFSNVFRSGTVVASRAGNHQQTEATMCAIIDLNSEVLVDRSQIRDAYLRFMLTAIGTELVRGSPWVAVDKVVAARHELLEWLMPAEVGGAAA